MVHDARPGGFEPSIATARNSPDPELSMGSRPGNRNANKRDESNLDVTEVNHEKDFWYRRFRSGTRGGGCECSGSIRSFRPASATPRSCRQAPRSQTCLGSRLLSVYRESLQVGEGILGDAAAPACRMDAWTVGPAARRSRLDRRLLALAAPAPNTVHLGFVGRSPWTAADALVGLVSRGPDLGVQRRRGRPPHRNFRLLHHGERGLARAPAAAREIRTLDRRAALQERLPGKRHYRGHGHRIVNVNGRLLFVANRFDELH